MDKQECMISIIIPMYNVENYIERCLDSIVQEDVDGIEVLLVDDGSADKTVEICREYEKKYECVHLFQQNHSGQGDARNLGVSKSKGKYIVFCDSDDYYEVGAMNELYEAASKKDADIFMWGVQYLDREDSWKKLHIITSKKNQVIATMNLPLWDKMFKKTFWEDNNIKISNRYSEDIEVDVFLVAKAKKIYIIPKVLYNYSMLRDGNLTSNVNNVIQSAGSICNMLNKFKENSLFEKHRAALQYLCCRDAYYHITNSEKVMTVEYQNYVKENFYSLLNFFFQIPKEFVCSIVKSRIIVIGSFKYLREFGTTEFYYDLENYLESVRDSDSLEYNPIYIIDVSKELDLYKHNTLEKQKALDKWELTCVRFLQIVKSPNVFLFHDMVSDNMEVALMAKQIFFNIYGEVKDFGFDDSVELFDKVIKNMTYKNLNLYSAINKKCGEISASSWERIRIALNQNILNTWLTLKLNNDSLERYFIENDIKNIAIYGIGFLGSHLLCELKDSKVNVSYVIDKNKEKFTDESIKGVVFGEELPETGAIIVTPVQFYDLIYMELRCYTDIPIISLKQVIEYFL